jgi:hypothetical protein
MVSSLSTSSEATSRQRSVEREYKFLTFPATGESQPRLSVYDLTQAEVIIKAVQSEEFGKEIEILTSLKTEQHPSKSTKRNIQLNKTSSLYKLDPFVDDNGILRVGSRLRRANLSENHKFPIILPKNNHVSNLIVRDFHERVKHQGRGITLNEIRSNVTGLFKEQQLFPSV